MKALRVRLTDEEYKQLRSCITHHGEISHILRKAVKEFIAEKRKETIKRAVHKVIGQRRKEE